MPRPCLAAHPPSPEACRLCRWCADPSETGAAYRRLWGEPDLPGDLQPGSRELLPGLPDPIPVAPLDPLPDRWAHDRGVIRQHRQAFRQLCHAPLPPPGPRAGTGVLMIGGGMWWVGNVLAVRMLRETGCTLPVQIWHRGDEEPVRPADLAGLGDVTIRDLTAIRPIPRAIRVWEFKTVALLACGWERVFYHDADAYCVADPTPLLERLSAAEPFLYWEDFASMTGTVNWTVWDLAPGPAPPVQGGHYAIHLTHFWREFVLAYWLDQHSDFSYAHQYGDQDSWRIVLAATGGRYTRLGRAKWDEIAFVCAVNDTPMVIHRVHSKMVLPEHAVPGDHRLVPKRLDRLPWEARAWAHWEALVGKRSAAEVFGNVYASGQWGPDQTSGSGSTPSAVAPYVNLVNGLIRTAGWRRVIDLGCGDGYIHSRLVAPEVVGVDCHAPHVERHRREHPDREWHVLDLDRDRDRLPAGDVALLKDVMQHWPNGLIRDWLTWARGCGEWKWVVCTQDRNQTEDGQDCALGGYRALDPTMEPLRCLGLEPFGQFDHKGVLLVAVG